MGTENTRSDGFTTEYFKICQEIDGFSSDSASLTKGRQAPDWQGERSQAAAAETELG